MKFVILLVLTLLIVIGCDKDEEDNTTTGPQSTFDGKHIMIVTWDGENGQMVENERIYHLTQGANESEFQALMDQVETFIKSPVEEFQWTNGSSGLLGHNRVIEAMWQNSSMEFVESEILFQLKDEYSDADLDTLLLRIDASLYRPVDEYNWGMMILNHLGNPIPTIESLENHPLFNWLEPNMLMEPF
ncbi:MAG: hypothetical protein P9L92_11475 [Candidatus Electryonea clarkiae]|nr:hypothetical protein [Candidatus Electryonea clarkiae]MDP8287698.1 hypothetical protein [Candidatus Electryonea clarkiae]